MKLKGFLLSGILAANLYGANYTMELLSGVVYNESTDVTVRQPGKQNIVMKDADIETHAQTVPYYYGLRVTRWHDESNAWEFAHLHQKLYIDEPTKYYDEQAAGSTIENWEMTDGFNFFVINRVHRYNDMGLNVRVGGGVVIAHPDVTIDGVTTHKTGNGAITWGDGYQLCGFVIQSSAQKTFDISKKWYLSLEARASYAKATVNLAGGGDTSVTNKALHLNYGVGYRF